MRRYYITTAIPYVNAAPHLGHALELVQADVLARHRRVSGDAVRFCTGTDDNAVKNVTAAAAAGVPVREFVDAHAGAFQGLREPLSLSTDDFIRTSSDRHRTGVEALWRRCALQGDFYRRSYRGLYCPGCEQFYATDELRDGRCPEHATEPAVVEESNWFFRLSAYQERVREVIESGRVRIDPPARRNEVLAFVRAGLEDFSVSRPAQRSGGWGIGVPDDPTQIVYVWWDALANYITALGYGSDGDGHREWWTCADERVHVIGKGILRFHAVYWLAALLSVDEPLPTRILVHDYLSVDGAKLSKSAGNAVDPRVLVDRFGTDAVRWWLLRDVAAVGDTDFTIDRLVDRADVDLANRLGNLVNRVVTLVWKYRDGRVPSAPSGQRIGEDLVSTADGVAAAVDAALDGFDFRQALAAVWRVVDEGNRLVEATRPWELARAELAGDSRATETLDAVLARLVTACRVVADELAPFIPDGAARLRAQLDSGERLAPPVAVFPRLGR